MAEDQSQEAKRPKDRSPSFPYIGLSKALERAGELYAYGKRFETRIADASKPAWDLGAKSSSTAQTVGALMAYGLIEDSGTGENRKIKVSDLANRALLDQRPGAKEAALAEAALKPKLIAEFFEKWGVERPPEPTCLSELMFERNFTPEGAKAFLRVYDDTVSYAGIGESDKLDDNVDDKAPRSAPPGGDIAVGDAVRVEVAGQIMVEKAIVRAIHEHEGRDWVFVEGSETGVLMSDATLLEKGAAAPPSLAPPTLPLPLKQDEAAKGARKAVFPISDGDVVLTFPEGISGKGLKRLKRYLDIFLDEEIENADGG